jgi:hypothetical protein
MENCRIKQGGLRILSLLIAGAVLMTAPISAWALHLGSATGHGAGYTTVKAEDVRNTMHNLSTSNPINGVNIGSGSAGTTEVCVFCHTPHGADVSNQAAPLWNRALPTSAGYSVYSSANFDATAGQPVGVSLACLSCHDGATSLDALINAGGSGGFFNGARVPNLLSNPSAFLDGTMKMNGATRTDTGKNYQAMVGGASPFPNLGTKLSDDHPISFPMITLGSIDPQFTDVTVNTPAGKVLLIARVGTLSPVDRRDAIRLYPAGGGVTAPTTTDTGWVECASCHNPHAPRPLFLRLPNFTSALAKGGGSTTVGTVLGITDATLIADNPNAGSAVCISCHEK